MSELNLNIEPMQFKNIVVGVDESKQGYFALANAIHQAHEDDAKLIIASVLEMGDLSTIDALHLDVIKEKRAEVEANLAKYKAYAESKGITNVTTIFADGAKAGEALLQEVVPKVDADLIIVLDDGQISAMGTNDELLESSAIYKEIYETQKKGGTLSE